MSISEYIMRSAEFSDVSSIFELIKEFPDELLARSISDIRQNIDRFFVCEDNGKLAGAVSWQILPEMGADSNPTVEIKSLCVRKDLQGKGIGSLLLKKAISHIKHLHPSQVIVLTFTSDFFRKFGFQDTDKTRLMHKLYLGCINCTKYDSPFTCPEVAMTFRFGAGGSR